MSRQPFLPSMSPRLPDLQSPLAGSSRFHNVEDALVLVLVIRKDVTCFDCVHLKRFVKLLLALHEVFEDIFFCLHSRNG
jgi:hypothetical protein